MSTDMLIKADSVIFGNTVTHTTFSGSLSSFYSVVNFNTTVQFVDSVAVGYVYTNGFFLKRDSQMINMVMVLHMDLKMYRSSNRSKHLQHGASR